MVSRKKDVNWDAFVQRMSAGLPIASALPNHIPRPENPEAKPEAEASKNPFSPSSSSSRPVFTARVVEDDGLQVVPEGTSSIWNQRLVPVPLRLSTGVGGVGARKGKGKNPFSKPSPDAEGLQVVGVGMGVGVSPITPGSHASNTYTTPVSLQTPLNPWSAAGATSNNPFSHPRYADAEGLQAVVSNLGMGVGEAETGDAYAVSRSVMGLRNPLPYPMTPELRSTQPVRDPWTQVLQDAFPGTSQTYGVNYPVQPPFSDTRLLGDQSHEISSNEEILIAVFGMTGTGKTTFIEKASGQKLQVGHNLHSCSSPIPFPQTKLTPPPIGTTNIQKIHCKIGGRNITLVDTPGFDDTSRSDTDILILIASWLRESYKENTLLSGIIYLHRISDPRMSGSSVKNLRLFRKLCGAESMHNVALVTTMWDRVNRLEGETRERDLKDGENGFWKAMIGGGCAVRRHDGSEVRARELVAELAGKRRTVLRLQEEMRDGKSLSETEAGVSLNEELVRVRRQHEEELSCVMEEMEAAMKSGLFPSLLTDLPLYLHTVLMIGRKRGTAKRTRSTARQSSARHRRARRAASSAPE